jgi:glucose-1-phosphate thymidylyltransferase
VYDKPMIYYPIKTLVDADIKDILVVTGGNSMGDFIKLLGDGRALGARNLSYVYQEGEGGIAAALLLAEFFASGDKIAVILGDNIIEKGIRDAVDSFRHQNSGARILLKEVSDPQRFGVAEIDDAGNLVRIYEKPQQPPSNYAVTGIYMYDFTVFHYIRQLVPSKRGELEITDVNNFYIETDKMKWSVLDGWWTDAGTFESLLRASNLVAGAQA